MTSVVPMKRPTRRPPATAPGTIRLGTDLHRVVDEGCMALALEGELYTRGGRLVRIVRDADTTTGVHRAAGAPSVMPIKTATLRELLTRVSAWEKFHRPSGSWVLAVPSDDVVGAVLERGTWPGIHPLVGVLETPALRPDGTIIEEPGYDLATGYVYLPSMEFPRVPSMPVHADAVRARDELLEVVRDFPFASDAHRAAWLAFALTPFARPAIDGCVPCTALDATTAGTGKGLLFDATALIATGREGTKTALPQDDAEARKRITSLVIEGEPIVCVDNVRGPIDLPSLEAALTATRWSDRRLGVNESVSAPHRTIWCITGNNLVFKGDMHRRVLHIRLESPLENPEDRDNFAHPELLGWVRDNRGRLVTSALTLLRAYVVAGCPAGEVKAWGSFEAWSRIVAGAVAWVGLPDPQRTRTELVATADTVKMALVALLDGWMRLDPGAGLTAKGCIKVLWPNGRPPEAPDGFDDLRDAIEQLTPMLAGKTPSGTSLGYQLRAFRKRVIGGRMFDCVKDRTGSQRWKVVSATAREASQGAGDAGDAGDVPNPTYEKQNGQRECETSPASHSSPALEDASVLADDGSPSLWVNGAGAP